MFDLAGKRVFVAGHGGMVGRAVVRRLGREQVELVQPAARLDYRRQAEVEAWMGRERPQVLVLAAARVGGILANSSYPADFIYDNMMIEANLIEGARQVGVEKLIFLGSSCIYPKDAPQPMAEGALLTGPLEPTNQWYAIAKIAGIKLAQAYRRQYGCDFICAQPTNLYGPFDNFDLSASHVIPALMRKAHEAARAKAASLTVWGSGRPQREFLHVDDLADAVVFLLKTYSDEEIVNVGSGDEVSIAQLATLIAAAVGLEARLELDASKPDGVMRKLVDIGKIIGLGWAPTIPLEEGLKSTYQWFLAHEAEARGVGA
ncbi:MAG TPA: GDP-L-fucose synthase [Caulobacteraceae bacterium]|nr:GDP-L-fucose synthase [Caulobacteraceae bacterium]